MAEAAQFAGSVTKGVGAYQSGMFNAKQDKIAATAAEQDGSDEEARIRQNARGIIGQQIAAQGESGFQQGTGSALEALQQSQVNATLDALTARRQAAAKARSLRTQASIAHAGAKNALVQSLIGAGSSAAQNTDWGSSGPGGSATPAAPQAAMYSSDAYGVAADDQVGYGGS